MVDPTTFTRSLYREDALTAVVAEWAETALVSVQALPDGWAVTLDPPDDPDLAWAFATHVLARSIEKERGQ